MGDLDSVYLSILSSGLTAIRNASQAGDVDYCYHEAEHLHEIPMLVGQDNSNVHIFYATVVRAEYVQWVVKSARVDRLEFVRHFYLNAWSKLDAILGTEPVKLT